MLPSLTRTRARIHQTRQSLDVGAVTSLAFEALSQSKSVDEVVSAHAKTEDSALTDEGERRKAHAFRAAQLRVLKDKKVAAQLEALRAKRRQASGEADGEEEEEGKKGVRACVCVCVYVCACVCV